MAFADVDVAHNPVADAMPIAQREPAHHEACSAAAPAVHRLVEREAALRGDEVAIRDGDRVVTWRELNGRANAVARDLMAAGFRRGDVAQVAMPRSADLAVVLLAIVKAGGCYAWVPDGSHEGESPCVLILGPQGSGRTSIVHVGHLLTGAYRSSPNLPVMVRGTDAACLIQREGTTVLVPHASLTALRQTAVPSSATWAGDAGALGLWILLMAGAVVTIGAPYACAAA